MPGKVCVRLSARHKTLARSSATGGVARRRRGAARLCSAPLRSARWRVCHHRCGRSHHKYRPGRSRKPSGEPNWGVAAVTPSGLGSLPSGRVVFRVSSIPLRPRLRLFVRVPRERTRVPRNVTLVISRRCFLRPLTRRQRGPLRLRRRASCAR